MVVDLYDTTLRDGSQQEGISLSVDDKIKIAVRLDQLGIPYIEGGWPGSNPKDSEFFQRIRTVSLVNSRITAFGSTRRARINVSKDSNINALLDAETPVVTIVGKSSELQVLKVLETSMEENLDMISESINFIKDRGRTVFFDAEHFFDGFRDNSEYAVSCLKAAAQGGADCIVLCDTNGGMLTGDIADIVSIVARDISTPLGIHCHNDADVAVANSIAAVMAGAVQIQGTINGYGERCGNANLLSIIANLKLKMGIECVTDKQLSSLTEVSQYVSEIVNIPPDPQQPYVGSSSFSHKGGLHAAAVAKIKESYQHVVPEAVGNSNKVVISELSGRGNVQRRVDELGLAKKISRDQVTSLLETIKALESNGFQYEGAAASFDLMVMRKLEDYRAPFDLVDFMVLVENRRRFSRELGREDILAEAMVKVKVVGDVIHTVAEGNGPVNALDNALRKALMQFYPSIGQVKLLDYKVRVVDQGQDTRAVVRVLIDSSDGVRQWQTVGASSDVIEASWLALADSLEYFLANLANNGE